MPTIDALARPSAAVTSQVDADRPSSSRYGGAVLVFVKVAVSVGLLAVLATRIDFAQFWNSTHRASPAWLAVSLVLYFVTLLVGAWRWHILLRAQHVSLPGTSVLASALVASFFNNFLPSNIGGDVVRIRDTASAAGSKTLATTVVLIDRGIGVIGLVLVAAIGATATAGLDSRNTLHVWPSLLWIAFGLAVAVSMKAVLAPAGIGRLLQPLQFFHAEWVGLRITRITDALARFREQPRALALCFGGAFVVQSLLVVFHVAIARSMNIPVRALDLAVIVPVSFIIQMLPVSVNGFGVREATFGFYFARLGLPLESALAVSLVGIVLVMVNSLTGAVVYVFRHLH